MEGSAGVPAMAFVKFAFQSLPPLIEFLAVRLCKEFELRRAFEARSDDLHDAFLHSRGITQEMQSQAHATHLRLVHRRALF